MPSAIASLVERVRQREKDTAGSTKLTEAVARYYAKLMAYKDEYEVARLHTDGAFEKKISSMFEGDYKLVFHLAPPLLARRDPHDRRAAQDALRPLDAAACFRLLQEPARACAAPRSIRSATPRSGAPSARLIAEYEADVDRLLAKLSPANHALAVQIASMPEEIRGFGHVKMRHLAAARKKRDELIARLESTDTQRAAA